MNPRDLTIVLVVAAIAVASIAGNIYQGTQNAGLRGDNAGWAQKYGAVELEKNRLVSANRGLETRYAALQEESRLRAQEVQQLMDEKQLLRTILNQMGEDMDALYAKQPQQTTGSLTESLLNLGIALLLP